MVTVLISSASFDNAILMIPFLVPFTTDDDDPQQGRWISPDPNLGDRLQGNYYISQSRLTDSRCRMEPVPSPSADQSVKRAFCDIASNVSAWFYNGPVTESVYFLTLTGFDLLGKVAADATSGRGALYITPNHWITIGWRAKMT